MISHWRAALAFLTALGVVVALSSFQLFTSSSASGSWITRTSMPAPSGNEGAAVVNGKIYVIGGRDSLDHPIQAVQIYDPGADSWSMGAPMPTARSMLAVVSGTNGRIYTIGGRAAGTDVTNIVEEYDPATNTWQTRASVPLSAIGFAAAATEDGKIYVFGGYFGCCGNYANSTFVYDPPSNIWSTVASMPTAREGGRAALAPNGRIYVVGGNSNTASETKVEEYNPATNTWATRSPLPLGGSSGSLVTGDDGMLYLFDGGTGYTQQYNPATDAWSLLPEMPTPRTSVTAAAPGDGYVYTFGGALAQSPFPYTWVSTNEALALGSPTTPTPTPTASPSLTPTPTPVNPGPPCGIGIHVTVPAAVPWTDTGIDLSSTDQIDVCAHGVVYIASSDDGKNPDGAPPCGEPPPGPFLVPGLRCWALIGRVASGTPFDVGTTASFIAGNSGRLYLGMNDNFYGDNSGSWDAWILINGVIPSPTPTPTPTPVDSDGDGIPGTMDNCPDWANPTQALPSWPVPSGDADCDGFPDPVAASGKAPETYIGTDPAKHCAATMVSNDESTPDAWPPDFNDDQIINGQDKGKFGGPFGSYNNLVSAGPFGPPGNQLPGERFDFNGDGAINGQDTGKYQFYYNKTCA